MAVRTGENVLRLILTAVLAASGVALITKADATVVIISAIVVSVIFGILFTYILRREVKLPHGEGVRVISLIELPWRRGRRPYSVVKGKVVPNPRANAGGDPGPEDESREAEPTGTPR